MRRAEKVRPDHILGSPGGGGDFVYIQRGGVRRENRSRFRDLVEARENIPLDRHLLEHRFHDEVGRAQVIEPHGPADPLHPAFRLRGFDLPSAHRS